MVDKDLLSFSLVESRDASNWLRADHAHEACAARRSLTRSKSPEKLIPHASAECDIKEMLKKDKCLTFTPYFSFDFSGQ